MAIEAERMETWQRVTQYVVSAIPEGLCPDGFHWDLTVEWRGEDRWAVMWHGYAFNGKGRTDYERQPSSRTDAWKRAHYFPEAEALQLAHKFAPTVKVNGLLPADLVARHGKEG